MKLFLLGFSLLAVGCVHCGPVCQEARAPKKAFITQGCKVTFDSRKCEETTPEKAESSSEEVSEDKSTEPNP